MRIGLFSNTLNINFMSYTKYFFGFSALLIIMFFVVVFVKGFNLGVDFKGGIAIELQSETAYKLDDISKKLHSLSINNFSFQEFGNNTFQIIVSSNNISTAGANSIINTIRSNLTGYKYLQTQFVGPSVSKTLIQGGIFAVLASFLGIFAYLWLRFDWQYGIIGVITLCHDVLVSLAFLSLFHFELNLSTIAAILTIIGYSINDTVVIFDQVRENTRKYIKETIPSILNRSLNQVFSRSISASVTVFLVLCSIFLLGGETLQSFSFTLLIGVFFGTYSSICIATPMLMYIGDIKAKFIKKS
ncbi:Protein translocase subunit SecF [Candidatus Hepatincola sp. Av]